MFTDESRKLSPNGNRALNINSTRNLSDLLANQIIGNVDVLVISERKFDVSLPVGQFRVSRTPFKRDRYQYGGELLAFVRERVYQLNICVAKVPQLNVSISN